MIYIYALSDPSSMAIRYIGKSIRLDARMREHLREQGTTYPVRWIQSLLRDGKRPTLTILETLADESDWQAAEKRWIAHGKTMGWKLTNCTDGGDGVVNLSGEGKIRLLQTWQGRKHKPSSLLKIGNASRGRMHTEEYKIFMRERMTHRAFTSEHHERLSQSRKRILTPALINTIRTKQEKLRHEEAWLIKKLLAHSVSMALIARLFFVSQRTIFNIKRGQRYTDVPFP